LGQEIVIGSSNYKEKHADLEVPNSLPDTLIEKYGLDSLRKQEEKTRTKNKEHPQKLPLDLVNTAKFLEKIPEETSKIEFITNQNTNNEETEVLEKKQRRLSELIIERIQRELDEETQDNLSDKKEINKKYNKKTEHIHPSFFDELQVILNKDEEELNETFSSSIVAMMKKYHEARVKGEYFFFHEKDMEDVVYKKILKLKELEKEWLRCVRDYNSAKDLMEEKEDEIEIVSTELKKVLQKTSKYKVFNKITTQDESFKLNNGKTLFSLNDLIRELKDMSEDVFNHHVNVERNDFSDWANHVFDQKKLAFLLKNCKNKEEMLKLLQEY